jgi:integrase
MPVYRRKYKDRETGETHLCSYYFKFDVDGITYKETVKTARTKKQAAEAERRARDAVHAGLYGQKGRRQLFETFARDVWLRWAGQHHRDTYNDNLRVNLLCGHFKGLTLAQISQIAIERFKSEYAHTPTKWKRPRAARTVNIALDTLSSILTLAVGLGYVRENPCRRVRSLETEERPPRRLSSEEEGALLSAAECVPVATYLRDMIRLALWTGLREGELIALRMPAVDFGRNRLFVVNPKWRRDRRKTEGVPLGSSARALLEDLCASQRGGAPFTDASGKVPTRQAVVGAFRRACDKAGIVGLRFHDLRHEYGSRLGDADVNLKKIALLMGHSRTRQTERYVHPDEGDLLAATEVAATASRSRIVPERLKVVAK